MDFANFSRRQTIAATWWNRPKFKDFDGIICDGSIRAGKTMSMTIGFVVWSMYSFKGQTFALCGKTIESLRRNVVQNMGAWLDGVCSITERRNENKLIITAGGVTNTYYLFGGRDESSYMLVQGITLAGVFFDEVALMPRSFVQQALARCSVPGSKFWFNCNPEGPQHWFYTEWVKRSQRHNVLHLHFTMADNPGLNDSIRKRYESLFTGAFYRRYILGEWVKAEGLVYPMFDRDKHIVYDYPAPSPRHRYYVSVDYGTVNPFAAGLFDFDPQTQTAIMLRELYYKGGSAERVDNESYYAMLADLIGGYDIEYIIIDPSAAAMRETIDKYGKWLTFKADNDVLNGIQDVTKYLNAGVLKFYKDCTNTFAEFDMYAWDEDKPDDTVIKADDHAMDMIRYFCRTALRTELKWDV